jgi:hypothetical protein
MNANVSSTGSFFAPASSEQNQRTDAVSKLVNKVAQSGVMEALQGLKFTQSAQTVASGGAGLSLRNVSIDDATSDVSQIVMHNEMIADSLVDLETAIRNDTSTVIKATGQNIIRLIMTVILVVVILFTGLWVFNLFLSTYTQI